MTRWASYGFGPPDSYWDPPEPTPCCALAEDDDNHDVQACLDDQAEAYAEARAERIRDDDRERWLERTP